MNIVAGADDRFAMPMAVTLYSALANMVHGWAVSLYIVDGGISIENRSRLEAGAERRPRRRSSGVGDS